jgi:hypothetical protein
MIVAEEDDLPLRTAPPTQPRGVRPPSIRKTSQSEARLSGHFLDSKFVEKWIVARRNLSQMLTEEFAKKE